VEAHICEDSPNEEGAAKIVDERQIGRQNMKMTTTATPLELIHREPNISSENADRLDFWKEIAKYLNRNVRTVQRWEALESMPIHRHLHAKSGSVYAFRSELDAWRKERSFCRPSACDRTRHTQSSEKALINDKEQAHLRTVLEAILVQLTTQMASAHSSVPRRDLVFRNPGTIGEL